MMGIQQINLYQEQFEAQSRGPTAVRMVQFVGALGITLTALSGYALWQQSRLSTELAQLEATHAARLRQAQELREQLAAASENDHLEARITRLRQDLERKKRVLALVSGDSVGNPHGFSSYLEALAQQVGNNLWLTEIVIARGGDDLGLRGSALEPEAVPAYLQALSSQPDFRGKPFRAFGMAKSERGPWVDFAISTAQETTSVTGGINLARQDSKLMAGVP